MAYGFFTPTHLLLILAAIGVFVALSRTGKASRDAARRTEAHERPAERAATRGAGLRRLLARPTRAQCHLAWLVASALIAFALTRAAALPLFLAAFLVLWLAGFGVLVRLYR